MKKIKTPHLPQGRVGLLALGERYKDALARPLSERGVEALWLPDNLGVDPRLAGHGDLSLFHPGGGRLVASFIGDRNVNILTNRGFELIPAAKAGCDIYPGDCRLNGCLLGRYFIHSLKYTDPAVLAALSPDTVLINVNQGYAKCSVCVVDERSIITADPGIAKAAALHGIDVLRIHPGFVELPGFDTGFIGGAAFKLSSGELAFTGTLDGHPSRGAILDFLRSRGIDAVYLTALPVFDIGSALPLTEL